MRLYFGVVICLGLTSLGAHAQDFPARKPGLWSVTSTFDGKPSPMGDMKMCLGGNTWQQMVTKGQDVMAQRCSKREHHMEGNTLIGDSVCSFGPSTATSHTVMTFPNDSVWHVDGQMTYAPPRNGKATSSMVQDSKWIGPCPGGMVPGDVVASNGMSFNINDPQGTMKGLPGMPPKRP